MPFFAKFGKKMGYGAKNRFFGVHKVVKIAFFSSLASLGQKIPLEITFLAKMGILGPNFGKKGVWGQNSISKGKKWTSQILGGSEIGSEK